MSCSTFKMDVLTFHWYLKSVQSYGFVLLATQRIFALIFPQEITLTTQTDPFFASQYLSTFGDLGSSLKTYVQSYQSRTISPSTINSIADMKRFVEEYPEFRKLGGNVSKHVALVGELSRIVGRDQLLEVGEVEQGLATASGCDLKVGYYSYLRTMTYYERRTECADPDRQSVHPSCE